MSTRFSGRNYSAPHRRPTVGYGNMIPPLKGSESDRPWFNGAPAAWLPLADTDVNRGMGFFAQHIVDQHNDDFIVVYPGKAVAFTRENLAAFTHVGDGTVGRLVPAGIRVGWKAAILADPILEYSILDVEQRTQDLTTGEPVVAAVSYIKSAVLLALQQRGLLDTTETLERFISSAVGLAEYSYLAWAGGDGLQPFAYKFHNYKKQSAVAVLCDHAVRLPYVPGLDATDFVVTAMTPYTLLTDLDAGVVTWATDAMGAVATGFQLPGQELDGVGFRYDTSAMHDDWVAMVLGTRRVEFAPHLTVQVDRAGVDVTAAVFMTEKSCAEELTRDGDFWIDREAGVIFFFSTGGAVMPTALLAGDVISLRVHSAVGVAQPVAAAIGTSPTFYASLVGNARPGDLLVVDRYSNLRPYIEQANAAVMDDATHDRPEDVVAQVFSFTRYPSDSMASARTHYTDLQSGIADRMPGSATQGYTDDLTLSGGGQFEVVINFMK